MKVFVISILFLFLFSPLTAQEICNNGIDDDGDGNIDLLDPDCGCNTIDQGIGDGFEDIIGCPIDFADLITEWSTVGTPQYRNTCGDVGQGISPAVPLPIPTGAGVVGLASDEGMARCTGCSLIAGETYTVSFNAAVTASIGDVEFVLYGGSTCNILDSGPGQFDYDFLDDCPSTTGWTPLISFSVTEDLEVWEEFLGTFTADDDYSALLFAYGCDNTAYSYIDFVDIQGEFTGSDCGNISPEVSVNVNGNCSEGYMLNAVPEDALEYQWYLDGLAIEGADVNPWDIDPLLTGDYQVRTTFADGQCAVSDVFPFTTDLDLVLEGDLENPSCFGDNNGSIELQINSANDPFDIEWNTGSTESTLENIGAGAYFATVTDANGCMGVAEFIVNDPPVLNTSLQISQPAGASVAGQVSASSTGGTPPYQYSWSNGTEGAVLIGLSAGIYNVTTTDANGCIETISFEIQEALQIDFMASAESCANSCDGNIEAQAMGGLGPYTYDWGGLGEGNIQENLCPGLYPVTLTDSFGTTITVDVLVDVGEAIDLNIEELGIRCSNVDPVSLNLSIDGGQPPYSFLWSTGAITEDLPSVVTGNYQVTVTDANGCENIQDYLVVPLSPREISFTTDPINCNWDEYQLRLTTSVADDLIYFLNEDVIEFNPLGIFQGIDPGDYTLSYEDANGCVEEIGAFSLEAAPPYQVFVDESIRILAYGEEVELEIQVNPESQLLLGGEITWSTLNAFDCIDAIGNACTRIRFEVTESGQIQLRFRDEIGCERLYFIPVQVVIPDYIYIPNAFSPNNDGINDEFAFFVTDFVTAINDVKVFNRWGGLVYENNDIQIGNEEYWDGGFNGKLVDSGVYVYAISLELADGRDVLLSGDITVVR